MKFQNCSVTKTLRSSNRLKMKLFKSYLRKLRKKETMIHHLMETLKDQAMRISKQIII